MTLNRYKAFGVHLIGSTCAALLSAGLVFLVWYPGLLASATGVTTIFLIVLGVDVVIGPLITLIVFNPAKKELRRDLAIVLVLQLAALAYGLHTVWVARPAYQIFNAGRFDLVLANEIDDQQREKAALAEFKTLPWFGPKTIGAKAPEDSKARKELLFSSLTGGGDLPQMPQYYLPYAQLKDDVVKRQQPLDKLLLTNSSKKNEVEALKQRYASRKVGFLPFKGKVKDLTVIVDADTAEVLELAELEPW
jgi:hypothetical protein